MRLIDADKLKEKLLKMQKDIANEGEPKENAKSDTWKAAYLLILDEYIKMVDEMPSITHHYACNHDCDAIYEAYNRGFLKGREDALSEVQLMKDYCDNDCNTTKEAAIAITKYLYKHETRKEQKMKLNMTKEEMWDKVIQNLKTLDQEAHGEEFVPLVTGLLVMTAEELSTDVIHSTFEQEDKSHMWSLVDDLGCYSIKGETIMYLPVYQELTTLMRKVF